MEKISLRTYIQQISEAIDRGQSDEAIAHCRHILETYPKYIETYRLLGKAYLESRRYGDAADIFQRVLSAVPDDFISHVGMSIIREDEGNLDAALWNMERAFEVQPYNAAIQSELRRLYGRRDGLEPPKVRLTRGALARMYAKGNLQDQAISELRAALTDDADRPDLLMLLAEMYAQNGQTVEAIETCSTLLKKLPYCLNGNRLLVKLLSETERASEAISYRQRSEALDPYEAHVSQNIPTAEEVPDAAVSIVKIDWELGTPKSQDVSQPEWAASLGVNLQSSESEDDDLPDWLVNRDRDIPAISPDSSEFVTYEASTDMEIDNQLPWDAQQEGEEVPTIEDENIPDWMKSAGWEPSKGDVEEDPAKIPFDESEIDESGAVAADIPEWLQEIAPPGVTEDEEEAQQPPVGEIDLGVEALPGWLDETPPGPTDSIMTWLDGKDPDTMQPDETIPELSPEEEEIPEMIRDLSGEEQEEHPEQDQESADVEATLDGLEDLGLAAGLATGAAAIATGSTPSDEDIPDWLKELGEEEPLTPPLEVKENGVPVTEQGEDIDVLDVSAEELPEIPELLQESGADIGPESEPDDLPDWLRESVTEETPVAAPESKEIELGRDQQEDVPEWLQDFEDDSPEIPLDPVELSPSDVEAEEIAEEVEDLKEDTPDWLEEDIALTPPEVIEPAEDTLPEAEEVPEWLHDLVDETPSELSESEESAPLPEEFSALFDIAEDEKPVLSTEPVETKPLEIETPDIPEWLMDTDDDTPIEIVEQDKPEAIDSEDTVPEWLEDIADRTPDISSEPISPLPLDTASEEIPEWLAELADEAPDPTTEPEVTIPSADVPDMLGVPEDEAIIITDEEDVSTIDDEISKAPEWLQELETKTPEILEEGMIAEQLEGDIDEIPDWLGELKDEIEPLTSEEPEITPSDDVPVGIPDWMKDTDVETPSEISLIDEGEETEAEIGEIPEWLQEIAPPEIEEAPETVAPAAVADELVEDFAVDGATITADGIAAQSIEPQDEPIIAEILEDTSEAVTDKFEPSPPIEDESVKDDLEELPEWLLEMADGLPSAPPAEQVTVEPPDADIPSYEEDERIIADVPLELSPDGKVIESETEDMSTRPEDTPIIDRDEESSEVPGWLQDLAKDTPVETEEVGVPDWLQGLTEEPHPPRLTPDEELDEPSEVVQEEIPDWLQETDEPDQGLIQDGELSPPEAAEIEPVSLVEEDLEEEPVQPPELEIEDPDAALAWLEGLAAKQGVSEEELITQPDERSELPPDWVKEDTPSEAIQEQITETVLIPSEETEVQAEIHEGVDFEDEIPAVTESKLVEEELLEPQQSLQDETDIAEGIDIEDTDSALAWLEGLASKQGVAEEELITHPDERSDIAPDWVQETAVEERIDEHELPDEVIPSFDIEEEELITEPIESELKPDDRALETPISEVAEEMPEEEISELADEESPEFDLEDTDAALAWLEGLAVKRGVDEEELITQPDERSDVPPDWVQEVVQDEIVEETPAESEAISDIDAEGKIDELDDTQFETEEDAQVIEELEPAKRESEEVEPAPLVDFEDAPTVEIELEPPTWVAEFDINSASLVQLERLPGIGFRRAQRIVAYREEHGPFQSFEELLNIPDIDADTLDVIRTQLTIKETIVSEPEEIISPKPEPEDETHAVQLEAQGYIENGDTDSGLEMYQKLIKKGERLDGIIEDLKAATYKHPMNVSILQTLGDAYMRAGNLQEALDTYTKAEELLR